MGRGVGVVAPWRKASGFGFFASRSSQSILFGGLIFTKLGLELSFYYKTRVFCSISEPDTTFSSVFLVFSFLARLEVLKNVEFCSVWRLFRRVSSFARFASMSLKHCVLQCFGQYVLFREFFSRSQTAHFISDTTFFDSF